MSQMSGSAPFGLPPSPRSCPCFVLVPLRPVIRLQAMIVSLQPSQCMAVWLTHCPAHTPPVNRKLNQEDIEAGTVRVSVSSQAEYGASVPLASVSDFADVVLDGQSAALDLAFSITPAAGFDRGEG